MKIFDEFKNQLGFVRSQIKDKEKESVRIDIMGVMATEIVFRENPEGGTVLVHGFDPNKNECVLVLPVAQFAAKLTLTKKAPERREIGFKVSTSKDETVLSE